MPRSVATKVRRMPINELRDAILRHHRDKGHTIGYLGRVSRVFEILVAAGALWADELERPDVVERFDRANPHKGVHGYDLATILWGCIRLGHRLRLLQSIPPLPAILHPTRRPKSPRSSPPSRDDVRRLLDHLATEIETWEGGRLYALTAAVVFTGQPVQQLINLSVADVDLAGNTFWIQPATGSGRLKTPMAVKISAELRPILAGWIRRTKCEFAFPDVNGLRPWNYRMGQKPGTPLAVLKKASRVAAIRPTITWEKLRRFHAEEGEYTFGLNSAAPTTRPKSATSRKRRLPTLRLGRPGEPAYIDGVEMPPLTPSQRAILSVLAKAGRHGLNLEELKTESGQGGCRETLMRLKAKHTLWGSIIVFPGRPHANYRLVATIEWA